MPDPFPLNLPPEDAIKWFRAKGYKTGFAWQDVWQEEHAHAFTVAKAMEADLLIDIREAVDKALADGQTLRQFRKELEPILQAKGWWGKQELTDPVTGKKRTVQLGSPRRLETILRVNLKSAYAAGRWSRIERSKETRPYLRYGAVQDRRTRPDHQAWHGTILPTDDPWWDTHYPPNGWLCRCGTQQLSQRDLDRRGLAPGTAPPLDTYEYTNPRTGEISQIPKGIDPGFAYNVGKSGRRVAPLPTPPPPPPGSIPILSESMALAEYVAGKKGGSANDGIYKGEDGVVREIKHHNDASQSYSEAVANGIYRALGIDAPESSLVRMNNGDLAHAAETIGHQGKAGLQFGKRQANKVLDGFAADVLLANWGVIGRHGENIVKLAGGTIARINQAGALLFKSKGKRKTSESLAWGDEWAGFVDPNKNPAYADMFLNANLPTMDAWSKKKIYAQIDKIAKLRASSNDFADLVPVIDGIPEADRSAILAMLRARAGPTAKCNPSANQRSRQGSGSRGGAEKSDGGAF